MPYVSIPDIPKGGALDLQRGDTWVITIQRLGSIAARDKLWWSLKDDVDKTDAQALVQIEETARLVYINGAAATTPANGSITIDDAAAGDITVTLAAVESAKLENVGKFYYDVQMLVGAVVTTLVQGRAVVMGDVIRETS